MRRIEILGVVALLLLTGETKTVGRYADRPEGGKTDGLEIRVTERGSE